MKCLHILSQNRDLNLSICKSQTAILKKEFLDVKRILFYDLHNPALYMLLTCRNSVHDSALLKPHTLAIHSELPRASPPGELLVLEGEGRAKGSELEMLSAQPAAFPLGKLKAWE